ncbi:DDE-type integrase/transposase/recombinase [Piscirickettsia salmonis]|uniref:DDE-type integrase/transposase/recombinase n=1 Tax=Piscirickettsia salmonis TaxID=1238 RepID=UPI001013D61B
MSDALLSGTKFRTMNLIDDYNRKALGIAIDFSMPAVFVTSKLDEWCKVHGYPEMLRTDNGPEFISSHFQEWAEGHGFNCVGYNQENLLKMVILNDLTALSCDI